MVMPTCNPLQSTNPKICPYSKRSVHYPTSAPRLVVQTFEEISTQNGPFNTNSNSMSSCVSQEIDLNLKYHIGLKQFFNINLGICIIKKNYFFCLYFRHISSYFYSNFNWESSLDVELNSTSNEYIITFFRYFLFFG